jgi:hypothetical protein
LLVGQIRRTSELRPDLLTALVDFIDSALVRDPASRPSLESWSMAMRKFGGRHLPQPEAIISEEIPELTAHVFTELRLVCLSDESGRDLLFRMPKSPVTGVFGGIRAILPDRENRETGRGLHDESVEFSLGTRGIGHEDGTTLLVEKAKALAPATPVPAVIATQAQPRPAPSADVDAVDCTVFAPPTAAPGDSILVQLFAHIPQQTEDVIQLAHEFDESAKRLGFSSLEVEIPRGSRLQVELTLPGLEIDEPVQYLVWRGRAVSVQFGVKVPHGLAPGVLIGKVAVYLEGVPIGHIRFKIEIITTKPSPPPLVGDAPTEVQPAVGGVGGPSQPQPLGDEARRYRLAFVSYAMKDLNEVMKRVQMLERLHVNFFQDLFDLEPGERWERKLYLHIDECDVFMLFWSTASKQSTWVSKEVQYALARKGGDDTRPPEIVPVLIEGPPVPLPNPELAHLHFNDKLLYYMSPLKTG